MIQDVPASIGHVTNTVLDCSTLPVTMTYILHNIIYEQNDNIMSAGTTVSLAALYW